MSFKPKVCSIHINCVYITSILTNRCGQDTVTNVITMPQNWVEQNMHRKTTSVQSFH